MQTGDHNPMQTTHNVQQRNSSGLIGLFLAAVMVCFVLMLGLFLVGFLLKIAPLLGFFVAIGGGVWYFNAKTDHFKLRAMTTVAFGLLLMVLGFIF
ncbi:MAG: hypothetical protein DPW16_08225 [Chloroflexi bacterium]|nr:hypothetical protein [Chloroflexota bacterium]